MAVLSDDTQSRDSRRQQLLEKIRDLNVWRRHEERAPHKPLLLLLALGRLQNQCDRLVPFEEIDEQLGSLLEEFGPPRRSVHPEYPFWRLQNDGLWEIEEKVHLTRRQGNTDPLRSELLRFHIRGGFPESIYRILKSDPRLVGQIARELLDAHFPDSLRDEILQSVGLELDLTSQPGRRHPDFRPSVLAAYEHACAFCGYSVRLDRADLGLDAAHIEWHQAGGPDIVPNGLACCTVHHQALDRGAISVTDEFRILVSSRLHGGSKLDEHFLSLTGQLLRKPCLTDASPNPEFLAWHRREVFREPPRDRAD